MKQLHWLSVLCLTLACAVPAQAAESDTASASAEAADAAQEQAVKPARKRSVKKVAVAAKTAAPSKAGKDSAALAAATDDYKKILAAHIVQANPEQVYAERPQALLRSVVVVQFIVDGKGKLVSSRIRRSNRDAETEAVALASLRKAAPLPQPPAALMRRGRLELHETWLFNNDGRFQIRSTALEQINQ